MSQQGSMIASKRSIKTNTDHTCAIMDDPSQKAVTIMIYLKKLTQEMIHLQEVVTRIDPSPKSCHKN